MYNNAYIKRTLPNNHWRMLDRTSILYILNTRPNAESLRAKAIIDTGSSKVGGFFIFPDDWVNPLPFTIDTSNVSYATGDVRTWTLNEYNIAVANGAVFFAATGYAKGDGTMVPSYYFDYTRALKIFVGAGYLWHNNELLLWVDNNNVGSGYAYSEPYKFARRLVMDVSYTRHTFSSSATNRIVFSPGYLQYNPAKDIWRFAENQYDFVGDNTHGTVYHNGVKCSNALMSDTYDGWIDLFGPGCVGGDFLPTMKSNEWTDYGFDDVYSGYYYSGTARDFGNVSVSTVGSVAMGVAHNPIPTAYKSVPFIKNRVDTANSNNGGALYTGVFVWFKRGEYIRIRFKCDRDYNSSGVIVGYGSPNSVERMWCYLSSNNIYIVTGTGLGIHYYSLGYVSYDVQEIEIHDTYAILDGVRTEILIPDIDEPFYQLGVFGASNSKTTTYIQTKSRISVYRYEAFHSNGAHIVDYRPVVKLSDGTFGMYDVVNGMYKSVAYGNWRGYSIPQGYTSVEYIKSIGISDKVGTYINTDHIVDFNNGEYISIDFSIPNQDYNNSDAIISSSFMWVYMSHKRLMIRVDGDSIKYYQIIDEIEYGRKYNIRITKFDLYIDGALSKTFTESITNGTRQMNLFGRNGSKIIDGMSGYDYKVYDSSNQLVQWLTPVVRDSDGKPGMYDLVGDDFLVNVGTQAYEFITGKKYNEKPAVTNGLYVYTPQYIEGTLTEDAAILAEEYWFLVYVHYNNKNIAAIIGKDTSYGTFTYDNENRKWRWELPSGMYVYNFSNAFRGYDGSTYDDDIASSLKTIRFSDNFDFLHVTSYNYMFGYNSNACVNLEYVYGLKMPNKNQTTPILRMFKGCSSLMYVDGMETWVGTISGNEMFRGCSSITEVNLPNVDITGDMNNMFYDCPSLVYVDLSSAVGRNATSIGNMFYNCQKLEKVNMPNAEFVTSGYMFYNCHKLKEVYLPKCTFSETTSAAYFCYSCYELVRLHIPNATFGQSTTFNSFCYSCYELTDVDIRSVSVKQTSPINSMFYQCRKITHLLIPHSYNFGVIENASYMLRNCHSIVQNENEYIDFSTMTITDNATTFFGQSYSEHNSTPFTSVTAICVPSVQNGCNTDSIFANLSTLTTIIKCGAISESIAFGQSPITKGIDVLLNALQDVTEYGGKTLTLNNATKAAINGDESLLSIVEEKRLVGWTITL